MSGPRPENCNSNIFAVINSLEEVLFMIGDIM